MKKAKYVGPTFYYLLLILFCAFASLFLFIVKEFGGAIFALCAAILFTIPYVIFRKLFFKKMLINEFGITQTYRKTILKQINWEDIKDIQYTTGQFMLSDKPLYTGKEAWKNSQEIYISIGRKDFIVAFYKYTYKIPVPIREVNKMPDIIRNWYYKSIEENNKQNGITTNNKVESVNNNKED